MYWAYCDIILELPCIFHSIVLIYISERIFTVAVNTVDTATIVPRNTMVFLKCSFHPQGWLKDGFFLQEIINATVLKFYISKQNDSGTYVCQKKIAFPRKIIYQQVFNVYIEGNLLVFEGTHFMNWLVRN